MSPQEQFTVGMNFLNMIKRLEEVFIQFFIPQCTYLLIRELVIAEEARDDLLPLSGDVELLLEPFGGGDNVTGGGGAAAESDGDLVAASGQGTDLVLHAIQGLLGCQGGLEELEVGGEASLLDGGSEVPPRLRGIFGIERREGVE